MIKPSVSPLTPSPRRRLYHRLGGIFGIDIRSGYRFGFRLRGWFFLWAGLAVFVGALQGLVMYSESPSFCQSCHIMEPYYKAWAASKHNHVACVECHYPPGSPRTILWKKFQALSQVVKYVTRTYSSRPFAEVEDASCLRIGCHADRLIEGWIVTEKGIRFDHRPHLEGVRYGRRLRCVSCHSQVVVGRHIEVTYNTCYLCHLEGRKKGREIKPLGKGCLGCHQLPTQLVTVGNITYSHRDFLDQHAVACQSCHQDVMQGKGEVDKDRCFTCHNQPEKLARYKETAFIHDHHVRKHNIACIHCHSEIRHGATPAGTKSLTYECALCHTQMHDLQKNFYRGIGAKSVLPMPSPMYLANVDCVGCHVVKKTLGNGVSQAATFVGSEQGCVHCHGKKYAGIVPQMKQMVSETITKLEWNLKAVQQGKGPLSPPGVSASTFMQKELADAAYNLRFVQAGHPVHNIYYAAQILRNTDDIVNSLAKKEKLQVQDTSDLPLLSGGFCATLCHNKVGVQVPPKEVQFQGKTMPHQEHIEDLGLRCTTCHLFGVHKDVSLKTPLTCGSCHDKGGK